jgi:DNA gyrase subunit A
VPVREFDENHFVFMATAQGTVKKTPLADFSRPRPSGIIAVGLDEATTSLASRSPTASST